MARLTKEFFRQQGKEGGQKLWADVSKEERSRIMAERARAGWAKKTKKQRSTEMKKRARVRAQRKRQKSDQAGNAGKSRKTTNR